MEDSPSLWIPCKEGASEVLLNDDNVNQCCIGAAIHTRFEETAEKTLFHQTIGLYLADENEITVWMKSVNSSWYPFT